MAINLAKKYQKEIAQQYTLNSLTKIAFGLKYDFTGAQTATVYTLTSQALGNYTRTGANRYGTPSELQDTIQDLTITRDRSFSITVDEGNYIQQSMVKTSGNVLKIQMEEQLYPEQDTYNLGILLASATTASQVPTPAALTASNTYTNFLTLNAFLDNAKVTATGRVAFMTPSAYNFIKLDSTFTKACDMSQKMLAKGVVGEIDGVQIIKVPASYMPTNTAMILTHPSANVAPMQLQNLKTTEDAPGINGLLVEGRFLYDAFTMTAKIKACAAWKIA